MLSELFHYLTTPCPRPLRRLGYLRDLISIHARYQRVKAAWQPHLQQCQQLMIEASDRCPQHQKVVVLGSGLLLDIPLEALSQRFAEVVLVDVAHLRAVKQRTSHCGNVTLIQHDLTGLGEALLSYRGSLPSPAATLPPEAQGADLMISANLLSQLPLAPTRYLQQHVKIDDSQLVQWQTAIIADHLRLLAGQAAHCCLICDGWHHYSDSAQQPLQTQAMLHGLELGVADQQWQWPIAPLGELADDYQLLATVQGFYNWSPGTGNGGQDSQ